MGKILVCTDGGAYKGKESKFDSVATFVIYKDNELLHEECFPLPGKTNNYAEMYAIYRASKYLIEYVNKYPYTKSEMIMFVTDSKLCQQSLTSWMKDWLTRSKTEVLISSSGKPVANQELIKSTFINILLLQSKFSTFVAHINSHKSKSDMEKMYVPFEKMGLEWEEFVLVFYGNDRCDKLVEETYNNSMKY